MTLRRTLVAERGINDSNYTTQQLRDGKYWMCPYYSAWNRLIRSDSPVDTRWLRFSCFREWMVKKKWEGKVLDRWLYGDGNMYGPEVCCFLDRVSSQIANGLNAKETMGIDTSHGMTISNPYRVTVVGSHLGYFPDRDEARAAWCKAAVAEFKRRNTNRAHREAVDRLYDRTTSVSDRCR